MSYKMTQLAKTVKKFGYLVVAVGICLGVINCGEVGCDSEHDSWCEEKSSPSEASLSSSDANPSSSSEEEQDYNWENVEYTTPVNEPGQSGAFISAIDSFFQAIVKKSTTEQQKIVEANLKNLIFEKFKQDKAAQEMGYNMECVKKYVMPRITKIELDRLPEGTSGAWRYNTGIISITENVQTGLQMTFILPHEFAHVFYYGEDSAELFFEKLSGRNTDWRRDNWQYGTYQIRGIYSQAKELGKEKEFWANLSSENGLRNMWNDLSPKYITNGKEMPILDYDEWQAIRQVSKNAFRRLPTSNSLINLSLRLEEAYNNNDPFFKENLRSEISDILENVKTYDDYGQGTGTNQFLFIQAGRELSNKVYNDTTIHDKLSKLRNLGFCNLQEF